MNATELPGVVGTAWGMADWHYGYGLPIGGVVATMSNMANKVVQFHLVLLGLTSIVVYELLPSIGSG